MAKINVTTSKKVVPMIYAYSTPEIARHNGWTKIGYTERDIERRIIEQAGTVDVVFKEEWRGTAVYDDGTGDTFTDKDFHRYLLKCGVQQESGKNNEWFHINGPDSKAMFRDFRENRGAVLGAAAVPYTLREEQERFVAETKSYKDSHEGGEYLWNAKPRFGKSLSAYEFCKRVNAENILIITNRPVIANSWYSDYEKFIGTEDGFLFVSDTDALKGKRLVLSRSEYIDRLADGRDYKCIEFISLQDLKGSIRFGGKFKKLEEVADMQWDVLIIDEAHEGVDTYKTDVVLDNIKRKFTLHLSGTPFKALANDKFPSGAISNWTYAEEQERKDNWEAEHPTEENPYAVLPRLNLFTYQMSEIIRDEIKQGVEINGETEEYAFDLNEFFGCNAKGEFNHDSSVDKFLDALTQQEKYPFSTEELRGKLKHTFWLLNRVDSAKALARKLETHPVFKDYTIVLAAGDGKIDDDAENEKSFDKVTKAIKENDKTITLSVGQLTTGVTIPEWTAVLMLFNIKSPSLYMQAAFRAQNPCLFYDNNTREHYRKENAYVFDFDPARTLVIFDEFANDLYKDTTSGRGSAGDREQNIRRLLNFFPVIGEDDEGEMIALDAAKVLSIPRKIKSREVVKRGFMSNYLFQNIGNIFNAPAEVNKILSQISPASEPSKKTDVPTAHVNVNDEGEVDLPPEVVVGTTADLFGEKIYENIEREVKTAVDTTDTAAQKTTEAINGLRDILIDKVVTPVIEKAAENYGSEIKTNDRKQAERQLKEKATEIANREVGKFNIQKNTIEAERKDALNSMFGDGKTDEEINREFDAKIEAAETEMKKSVAEATEKFIKEAAETAVKTLETKKQEHAKATVEDAVRDHLRGFTRTIPSFLMAYGDDNTTLATFDQKVPDGVFKDVTSITLDEFRFLRDGGDYEDEETHENKHFNGNLFDSIVFDDSVKEFMSLRKRLADYFDENAIEDIFDYIPPQKTNQIYTPKDVVKHMADLLEKENPGCFDDPYKTFIDLYMKSGLFITEVVKRLFNSPKMKAEIPDDTERLQHIFEYQVYGLAPTEIIYNIAKNYILGFSDTIPIEKHHLVMADAAPHAKDGTMNEFLDSLFAEKAKK